MNLTSSVLFNADDPKSYPSPPLEIIKGIIYKPMLTTIWGKPESGKSHIAIDMACTISQIEPVVYVAAEAPYEIVQRIKAWKGYYETDCKNNLHIWQEPVMLMDKSSVDIFITGITHLNPSVIFFDTLAQCFQGGNENETKDMTLVTGHLAHIIRKLSSAVCLIAHTGWETKHERGSSVLRAANRISASVNKTNDGNIEFKIVKMNAGKKPEPRHFTIKQIGDHEMQTILLPSNPKEDVSSVSGLPDRQKQILLALAMPTFGNGVTRQELVKWAGDGIGLAQSSVYDALNKLMLKELVIKKGNALVIISEEGREMAEVILTIQDQEANKSNIPIDNLNWILTHSNAFQPNSNDIPIHSNQSNSNDSNSPPVYKTGTLESDGEIVDCKKVGEVGIELESLESIGKSKTKIN